MAGEFKIKTGLLLGAPASTSPVNSIKDSSLSITSDASTILVTGKAVYDFVAVNAGTNYDASIAALDTSINYLYNNKVDQILFDASILEIHTELAIHDASIGALETSLGGYVLQTDYDASVNYLYNNKVDQTDFDASVNYLYNNKLGADASLSDLANVDTATIGSAQDGSALVWDNASETWVAGIAGGGGTSDVSTLAGLSDVTLTDASLHDIITPNLAGQWINQQKEWYVDSSLIQPVNSDYDMQLSAIQIEEDAGAVTIIDMNVSSTPSAGTEESYGFNIDGTELFTVYSEADGAGGIQNAGVIVKEGFTAEASVYFTGIDESSQTKALYYNPTSGEVSFDDVSTGGAGGSAAWGGITGNLEDQTDVSTAIDGKLSKSGGTISGDLVVTGDVSIGTDLVVQDYQYMGPKEANGSWRFYITNDASADMVFEKRVSGTWTEGGRFTV